LGSWWLPPLSVYPPRGHIFWNSSSSSFQLAFTILPFDALLVAQPRAPSPFFINTQLPSFIIIRLGLEVCFIRQRHAVRYACTIVCGFCKKKRACYCYILEKTLCSFLFTSSLRFGWWLGDWTGASCCVCG
jgi:hypothetical protein